MAKKSHLRAGKQNPEKFSLARRTFPLLSSLSLPPQWIMAGVFLRGYEFRLTFILGEIHPPRETKKKKKVVRSFYRENCNNWTNERELYHRCREGIVYRAEKRVGFSYEDAKPYSKSADRFDPLSLEISLEI